MNIAELTQKSATIHQNVMELLVNEEIEKQLKPYPSRLKKYINKVEVATYALNRLPTLYASSEEGKCQQYRQGRENYQRDIQKAVRRALAAIEQDPLRCSTPLTLAAQGNLVEAEKALEAVKLILNEKGLLEKPDLTWHSLGETLQRALNKMAWIGMQRSLNQDSGKIAQHSSNF